MSNPAQCRNVQITLGDVVESYREVFWVKSSKIGNLPVAVFYILRIT